MKVEAVADRIFIRLEPKEERSPSGLLIIEDIEEPRTIGVVESVGNLVKLVKPGDKVLFHIFDELETPDDNVVVVRENSILGVFKDE